MGSMASVTVMYSHVQSCTHVCDTLLSVCGWVCAARAGDLGWRAPAGVPGSSMGGHIVLTGEGSACRYCRQRQRQGDGQAC